MIFGPYPSSSPDARQASGHVRSTYAMRVMPSGSGTACLVIRPGLVEYRRAWEMQKDIHQQVADGRLPNVLLLMEHPHVYTLGRRGKPWDVLASVGQLARLGAAVHHIDRGGEVTYHGPGQLVGYPIMNLRAWGGGPLRYVRTLEQALVATLAEFGILAGSDEKPTGVWVGDAKVAAIGVKVSRGVTMHGFALNVNPDLSYFDHIVPCGMPGCPVTSMSTKLPEAISVEDVVPVLARQLAQAFGWTLEWATLEELGLVSSVL